MNYDKQYAEVDALFGTEPESTLAPYLQRLPASLPVLDIGAGQGRNALYLSGAGIDVHALEPSPVAAAAISRAAEQNDLPLKLFTETFERFTPPLDRYGGILAFGIWPDIPWPAIHQLTTSINRWSGPGTLVWATGFTIEDPAYSRNKAAWTAIGPHSYQNPEGGVRTYFEPGQVLDLFTGYEALHHWEGLGPEHRHGDAPPERHGRFETVLLKRKK